MNCVKIFEAAEAEKLVMDGQGFDTTEHVIEDNISESSFTADFPIRFQSKSPLIVQVKSVANRVQATKAAMWKSLIAVLMG